ncbi:MAG: hypothetical protein IJX90_10810 [Blautia sp.]|nr:hypothetical protein [Blautia sp.]
MKRSILPLICLSFILVSSGCALGDLTDRYLLGRDASPTESPSPRERVYMDEISGQLQSFDGMTLTLLSDNLHYTFDLSEAMLECTHGMLAGTDISVIYEGRLSETDTSSVTVLKVADVILPKEEAADHLLTGTILNMTTYSCTFRTEDGETITFPTAGAKQYYQKGLNGSSTMYLHYIGEIITEDSVGDPIQDASHVKVVSISDIDPYKAPPWKELVDGLDSNHFKNVHASILGVSGNLLKLNVNGFDKDIDLDISGEISFFNGGFLPDTGVNIRYTGEMTGKDSLSGISILSVAGDNPEKVKPAKLTGTVSGTVVGYTKDTVTVLTDDGMRVTCRTTDVPDSSTGGLLIGSGVSIIIDPAASAGTNILESLKIRDIF